MKSAKLIPIRLNLLLKILPFLGAVKQGPRRSAVIHLLAQSARSKAAIDTLVSVREAGEGRTSHGPIPRVFNQVFSFSDLLGIYLPHYWPFDQR